MYDILYSKLRQTYKNLKCQLLKIMLISLKPTLEKAEVL